MTKPDQSPLSQPSSKKRRTFAFQIAPGAVTARPDRPGAQICQGGTVAKAASRGVLPYKSATELQNLFTLSSNQLADLLAISPSTLRRRRLVGELSVAESERVVRYARLLDLVVEMMHGDLGAATQWLRSPAPALDNETPLEFATTEAGARFVETLIGRIRHGEFS